jgi:hypothetical protein
VGGTREPQSVVKEPSMTTNPVVSDMPTPEAQPQAKISPFGRVIGVFFSPKPTFADIAVKPSWLLPLVLMAILGVIMGIAMNQRVNWRQFQAEQLEKNPRTAQLTPEQKEQNIAIAAKVAPYFVFVSTIVVPIAGTLIVAGIMLLAYNVITGAGVNFNTALGVVSHAYIPSLIGAVLFLVVLFLKDPATIDFQNPVATNVAAFLPEGVPKWLNAMGRNIDILIVWSTLLMAIGFAAVNPRKLKGATPYTIAFGLLGVWIVIRMGLAFIFS